MPELHASLSIEKATGIPWDEWVSRLDAIEAKQLKHAEIAKNVQAILDPLPLEMNKGWWAQNVTVAYERHIGRRKPGQRSDGSYEVSVNKTFDAPPSEIMQRWDDAIRHKTDFNGIKLSGKPRLNETDKWFNWRAELSDGTKLIAGIQKSSQTKAMLGMSHGKLVSARDKETWRSYWKEFVLTI